MKNYIQALISISFSLLLSCGPNTANNKSSDGITADTIQTASQKLNLPEPYATKSVAKSSEVIGWSGNHTPVAPSGFTVTKYAGGLENPRWIYVMPNGDVLVAETKKKTNVAEKVVVTVKGMSKSHGKSEMVNRITLFRDSNNDGKPDLQSVFLEDLNMPFGMLLLKNYFYVANTDAVWRYPYKENETSIKSKGEKILDIPEGGRHWTRNIIASPGGSKIYISVGSGSDHAEDGIEEEKRRACILEINPDGSGERTFAGGLRNPVGMAWAPASSVLWTAVNERDDLGDDLPPDYMTSVKDGGFYGWPYSYYGQHVDPRIKENDQRPDLVAKAIVPDVPLGSHTASLGLAFYEQGSFPEKYQKGAFIGQHGSWNRSVLSGYKVVFVPFKNDKPGHPEDFLTGFIADEPSGKVYGRPAGVAQAKDGSLLVADDAGNTIWRVSYLK